MIQHEEVRTYCIVIRDPKHNIDNRLASSVEETPTVLSMQSARFSNDIAIASFAQNTTSPDSYSMNWENVQKALRSIISDYTLLYGESKVGTSIDEIMLTAAATIAIRLKQYKQRNQSKDGLSELRDYRIQITVGEEARERPFPSARYTGDRSQLEYYAFDCATPLSKTEIPDGKSMYAIAIQKPETGIGKKAMDEIGSKLNIYNPLSIRYSETIGTVSFHQIYEEQGPLITPSEWARMHMEETLVDQGGDYMIISGRGMGNSTIDNILLGGMAALVSNLTMYHGRRALEGELPRPFTDYRMRMSIESNTLECEFGISRAIVWRALRRILLEESGIFTDAYMMGYDSPKFSENDARILLEEITKHLSREKNLSSSL